MKRIIVSERTTKIAYIFFLFFIIIFFGYVYTCGDEKVIKEATWTCGFVGTWACMGLFGVRIITPKDIKYYGELYDKFICGAFSNDKWNYSKLIQAVYYYEHDRYKLATLLLDALLSECQSKRDYCAIWTLQGIIHREKEEYEEAIALLNQALLYELDNMEVLGLLGLCYLEIKDYDKLIEICEKELEIVPDYDEVLYTLAIAYALIDDAANAIKCFEQYSQYNVPREEIQKLRQKLNSLDIFV